MAFYRILFGLLAATFQALSYMLARVFSATRTGAPLRLLVASHVVMGSLGVVILPFVWPDHLVWTGAWWVPLVWCTVFYLIGQGLMLVALSTAEASKISPLLAIKVIFLSFLMWALKGTPLTFLQWTGVALCMVGAFVLNYGGGGLCLKGLLSVLGASLFYSLSDINIVDMVRLLETELSTRSDAIFFGVCMSYILSGLFCGVIMIFRKDSPLIDLKNTAGFAVVWLLAILFLFAAFSIVGVVYGNILQSTRGIISIVLGALIAKLGHVHLEGRVSKTVFIRRIIAGLIMTGAVVAFALS